MATFNRPTGLFRWLTTRRFHLFRYFMRAVFIRSIPGTLLAVLLTANLQADDTSPRPWLEYTFNQSEGTGASNLAEPQVDIFFFNEHGVLTDLYSEQGHGVSGQELDWAMDNSGSGGMGAGHRGGKAETGPVILPEVQSFTLAGWFQTATAQPLSNNAWLTQMGGGFGNPDRAHGFLLRASGNGQLFVRLATSTGDLQVSTPRDVYSDTQSWVFFALTFAASTGDEPGSVQFYRGSKTGRVDLVHTETVEDGPLRGGNTTLRLGNAGEERPFDGLMDNVRFFISTDNNTAALTAEQLEILRQADVNWQAADEDSAGAPFELARVAVAPDQPGDPIHGLDALLERTGHRPWDLFARDNGTLASYRVVFHDQKHGTEVWMLDPSLGSDHNRTASVWPAWNADASRLYLRGERKTSDQARPHMGWLFNADYSRLQPLPESVRPIWDREDPDIYYIRTPGQLVRGNARTGQSEVLAEWEPFPRERIYGFTADGKYLVMETPNGGLWVPYTAADPEIPEQRLYAGRPGGPPWPEGTPTRFSELYKQSNVGRRLVHESEEHGSLARIRPVRLFDLQTGEMRDQLLPTGGHPAYLQAWIDGRIELPEGAEWEDVEIVTADSVPELFEIYQSYPIVTHGHESADPERQFMAADGATMALHNLVTGERIGEVNASDNGSHYHVHWGKDPRSFIGWIRGWRFGSFEPVQNGNLIYQGFIDQTYQPVWNTNHRFNAYYGGGDFSMQSPDATKIHGATSMTGRFRNTIAVLARPRPPVDLQWAAEEEGVRLHWQAPGKHREIHGYLVYRSDRSGDGYQLLTPDPVLETSYLDTEVEPGQPYFYVLTSLEHSGLESGYSMEVARAGLNLPESAAPLRVYVEAEEMLRDLPATAEPGLSMGRDRHNASDWYYVYRHPASDHGSASLEVPFAATAEYTVWLRIASKAESSSSWSVWADERELGAAATTETEWTWVPLDVGPVEISEGVHQLEFKTSDASARLDLLCFSSDPDFVPEGPRPERTEPPPAIQDLQAENVRSHANRLRWTPSHDPGLAHYNVYASMEPFEEGAQNLLVGSPTEPTFVDWGLRDGTTYYYRVTAVDRRGNESDPGDLIPAATPELDREAVFVELTFDGATLTGPFEKSTGAGTRGEAFVVPQDPRSNAVEWSINLPDEGEYYLWLRHLHRGDGGRTGGPEQRIHVVANDQRVGTLVNGRGDFNVPDSRLERSAARAESFWTWATPGSMDLQGITLPAGSHTLRLENLARDTRYDSLVITNNPAWLPPDGRLRQEP